MISIDESYRHARDITRRVATTFYYTFYFLPPERRRSLFAVYAFSRRADDAVDSVEEGASTPARAREDLKALRDLVERSTRPAGLQDDTADPLLPALRDTMERYSIPRKPFDDLLDGMEMDMEPRRYETFEDLHGYCYRAAAVVGLIAVEIFGCLKPEAREVAIHLGIAMQLTNILRDVDEDLARGRIYLPLEDLRRFGCTEEDLRRGIVHEPLRALLSFEAERAHEHFRKAEPLYDLILPESRYCPILLMRFYRRILERIEESGFDIFRRRLSLRWHEKLRLAGATWLEAKSRGRAITSKTTSRSSGGA